VLLGLDHLVHALAEASEACVLTPHGNASHLSRDILVGADAALPSVADGGGAFQACVSLGAWEAAFAGLEGRIAFVAGPDADSVVGRHYGEISGWTAGDKTAFKSKGLMTCVGADHKQKKCFATFLQRQTTGPPATPTEWKPSTSHSYSKSDRGVAFQSVHVSIGNGDVKFLSDAGRCRFPDFRGSADRVE
jgi:hypothetical protein